MIRRFAVAALLLLLPGAVLAPIWSRAGLTVGEDDYLDYFPARRFFAQSVQSGEIPWWNPLVGLGRPFVADPQTAVWYPTTWLFALLPPQLAYATGLWLHYVLAAWAGYRLCRAQHLDRAASVFGGIALAFCGFLLAHRVHYTLMQAAAWTPIVFWRLLRYAESGGGGRLLTVAIVAALQMLAGHMQAAALTAIGTLVFLPARMPAQRRTALLRWLVGWLAASGLFAVQLLPTLAYLPHLTRVERTYLDFTENSWYPQSLVNWAAPMLFGQRTPNFFDQPYWGPSHQVEQFAYVGVVTLLLALIAVRTRRITSGIARGWLSVVLLALLLGLGRFGPLAPLVYWLPGANVFRVPARALLLADLALVMLAAATVHCLGRSRGVVMAHTRAAGAELLRRPLRWVLLVPLAALAIATLTALVFGPTYRTQALQAWRVTNPALLSAFAMWGLSALVLIIALNCWRRGTWRLALLPVLLLDLSIVGWTLDVSPRLRRIDQEIAAVEAQGWPADIRASGTRLWTVANTARVYDTPLDHAIPDTNVLLSIPTLVEYGPLQPRETRSALGMASWGVSGRRAELLSETGWMDRANLGWVLMAVDDARPPPDGVLHTVLPGGGRLYRRPTPPGMAQFVGAATGVVEFSWVDRSSFEVEVTPYPPGPRGSVHPIVVSVYAAPGWRAACPEGTTNGNSVPITRDRLGLIRFAAPADRPSVTTFTYRPRGLLTGAAVSAFTLALLVGCVCAGARRHKAKRSQRSAA